MPRIHEKLPASQDMDILNGLSRISPDVAYADWIRVGMVHMHYNGSAMGMGLWDNWSQGAPALSHNQGDSLTGAVLASGKAVFLWALFLQWPAVGMRSGDLTKIIIVTQRQSLNSQFLLADPETRPPKYRVLQTLPPITTVHSPHRSLPQLKYQSCRFRCFTRANTKLCKPLVAKGRNLLKSQLDRRRISHS
ncbi:PriCT-2 domain-containing protein [Candidatus Bealeia paramacronuclearis]|uniref:PriCT-2 domain-containing protein n=1 Tax=Candidatus Bealeia paramacronuclearis TaxID=1921001 RepID=UPI002F2600A8